MISIKTIVAPVDFSRQSEAAAQHAGALALHFDAKVLFVTVIEHAPAEHRAFTVGHTTAEEAEQLESEAGRLLRKFVKESGVADRGEAIVLRGDVAHRIESLADERGADLVVLPTRGRGVFRRFLLGSVTAKLLHDLKCPVLTGSHLDEGRAFPAPPYTSVCCAIGLREVEHSERVLSWAWDFAQSWKAELHVAHVPPAVEWGAGEWFPPETRDLVREAAQERLEELVDKVGCEAEVHVQGMETRPYVLDVIERAGCDLLVVGRSVPHGPLGGLHSNAYGLIRSAPCPAVSV